MSEDEQKAQLCRYLAAAREAMVWKLDGLSEYDVRRPMVPTGTNLLGLVKHMSNVEAGYFGQTFARPIDHPLVTWDDDGDDMADMWATESQSRTDVLGFYRVACAHADDTIAALPLDALGRVPWWPAQTAETSLQRLLVHVIAETNRHAGHADILRELIDGEVGLRADRSNLPERQTEEWATYRDRLERIAKNAAG